MALCYVSESLIDCSGDNIGQNRLKRSQIVQNGQLSYVRGHKWQLFDSFNVLQWCHNCCSGLEIWSIFLLFYWLSNVFLGQDTSRLCNYGNFGDKNHRFTCLLSSQGCDSFPKYLDLALAPNKTNKGVEKQWNTRYHEKLHYSVTCLAAFRLYKFS